MMPRIRISGSGLSIWRVMLSFLFMICLVMMAMPFGKCASSFTISVWTERIEQQNVTDGYITYTLTGDAAKDLRQKVLQVYDGAISPYIRNGQIESSELKYSEAAGTYIADIERSLEGMIFAGGHVIAIDPLHEGQGEPITIDAVGFVGEDVNTSMAPISIYLHFAFVETESDDVDPNLGAEAFHDALYTTLSSPANEPYTYDYDPYVPSDDGYIRPIWPIIALVLVAVFATAIIVVVVLLKRK